MKGQQAIYLFIIPEKETQRKETNKMADSPVTLSQVSGHVPFYFIYLFMVEML